MSALFDSLLETKVGRYGKIAQIGAFGYDAKGFLLEQSRADDSDEFALARRLALAFLLCFYLHVLLIFDTGTSARPYYPPFIEAWASTSGRLCRTLNAQIHPWNMSWGLSTCSC